MATFRCLTRGENFPGERLGQTTAVGVHTTRFVDAESATEAEQLVLVALSEDPRLNIPVESRTKNAQVLFESIVAVPSNTERVPNDGFSFFSMDA